MRVLPAVLCVVSLVAIGFLMGGFLSARFIAPGDAMAGAATAAVAAFAGAAVGGIVALILLRRFDASARWRVIPGLLVVAVFLAWFVPRDARKRAADRQAGNTLAAGAATNGAPGAPDTIAASAARRANTPPPLPPRDAADSLIALLVAPDSVLNRFATREYGYEERGLAVHGIASGWYLVATIDSARQWIRATDRDTLLMLDTLLMGRLNYLTPDWDGSLRAQPSVTAALVGRAGSWRASGEDRDETPANVLRTTQTANGLWLEVEVQSSTGCDGETPRVRATGWIPAYGARRSPTAWFFSRGC